MNGEKLSVSMNVSEIGIWNALVRRISSSWVSVKGTWISLVSMIDVGCESGTSFLGICFLNVIDFGFVNHRRGPHQHCLL